MAKRPVFNPGQFIPPTGPNACHEKERVVLMINKGKGWKWVANGKMDSIMEKFNRWPVKEGEQLEVWASTSAMVAHRSV